MRMESRQIQEILTRKTAPACGTSLAMGWEREMPRWAPRFLQWSLWRWECAGRWMCLVDAEAPSGSIKQAAKYRVQITENCEPHVSCIHFRLNCIQLRGNVPCWWGREKKWLTGSGSFSRSEVRHCQDRITTFSSLPFSVRKPSMLWQCRPHPDCIYSHKLVFMELSDPFYW